MRPGDWSGVSSALTQQNIVVVVGNDCKNRFYQFDGAGKPSEMLSNTEAMGIEPLPVPGATAAPQDWWKQPGLLPVQSQGVPKVSGPVKGICEITFTGGSAKTYAQPGSIVVPDTQSAYVLGIRHDPSIRREKTGPHVTTDYGKQGKPFCTIEPFVTLPTVQSGTSMAGGGLRNPGDLTAPDGLKPEPAAVAVIPAAEATGMTLMAGFAALSTWWAQNYNNEAILSGGRIVLNKAADVLQAAKEALGASPENLGELAVIAAYGEAPTLPEVKSANERLATPATERSESIKPPGDCEPNEHREMQDRVDKFCKPLEGGALRCTGVTTPFQNLVNARVNALCARERDAINNKCFDGGNKGHRQQAQQAWDATKNCLQMLLPR